VTVVLDVDDTRNCSKSEECSRCVSGNDLDVATYSTPIGVFCATVCPACADYPPDSLSWAGTAELVLAHCEHLGCDLDEMADALETERQRG
jgi:hypothetical protein